MKAYVALLALFSAGVVLAQPADPAAGGRGAGGGGGGRGQAVPIDSPVVSFGPTPSVALLVGEKNGGRLAIIDPESLEIVARIPVGGNFHELATDGKFAYMGTSLPGITVADVAAQRRVESIDTSPFGGFHGLFVAGGKVYIGHEQTRMISRYDPATGTFDWAMGMPGGSHLFKVSDDERTIYAPSGNGRVITLLENPLPDPNAAAGGRGGRGGGRGGWSFTTFPGDTRMEGFDVTPDGKEFWALNMNAKTITIIDLTTKTVAATIPYEGGLNNRIKFTLDGKYLLMNELQGTELRVWDVATRTEVRRIDVGAGGEGIFIDPVRPRAYYAVSSGNKLAVIDTENWTVIKEIPDLLNPDGMAWYVAQ